MNSSAWGKPMRRREFILKDNARPEARVVYSAMDMPWATLVGQIAQAYGK
jgi:hypothetical protein